LIDKRGWAEAIRAERQRRRQRPGDQRASLRRLTVTAAVTAAGLNAALFAQAGIEQVGLGEFQNEVIAAISGVFPTGGLQPAAGAPTPAPRGSASATTGGS
jgi:hypothetical protein